MSHPNPLIDHYTCQHVLAGLSDQQILDYNQYAEIDHCEDCGAPIVWSCCNMEVDIDEDGGFCPDCKEHVL